MSKDNSFVKTIENHLREYFRDHEFHFPESGLYDRIMSEVEKVLLVETLKLVNGNNSKAAKILGINRNTLRKKNNGVAN